MEVVVFYAPYINVHVEKNVCTIDKRSITHHALPVELSPHLNNSSTSNVTDVLLLFAAAKNKKLVDTAVAETAAADDVLDSRCFVLGVNVWVRTLTGGRVNSLWHCTDHWSVPLAVLIVLVRQTRLRPKLSITPSTEQAKAEQMLIADRVAIKNIDNRAVHNRCHKNCGLQPCGWSFYKINMRHLKKKKIQRFVVVVVVVIVVMLMRLVIHSDI